ncbi:LRR binding FLII interacting protein 1, transcript variant X4 [Ictidomys tridecemlineatus]|uniref:leucine-rich repeat flightless-interacting protein 1 isoform X8 n=1 Tax=Ictidomys tridecemlineatus TaxID=43179 RepID=UPI000B53DD41|nr:leucine-rich repeat flightless-interacting protein 1 isoform X8 [Ictidomys tridecemlineatus]KAG3275618.1 LRR binding FLII interacting protein 1, transcript variant X4 [Ictidomys tridecemlineatus]
MASPAGSQNKEIDCLSPEAQRLAEARLAAKRAARAEAREIRMKELERQQKEIYQVQKKYYGLDTKWGDIERWMEDSERQSRRSRRSTSASDEDERMSVGSRGSLRSQPDVEYGGPYAWTNGYDGELYGSQSLSRRSGRNSSSGGDGRFSTLSSCREEKLGLSCSELGLPVGGLAHKPLSAQNGNRVSLFDESSLSGARRGGACGSRAPSEYSGHLNSGSRASSRASSARASPVVEERPEKDFAEKGSRNMPGLSAATLASLGGTSSRRGSGDTSISIDTEASIREIKDSLAEVEEKYKKAMVSNAQLDNEKTNFMYQVDNLKDTLLELEEQLAESQRQYEEKSKEFEREKHAHSVLQFQFAEVKEALRQREEMLEEIRQLQQKQESYIREISDLQETIEWKDKKIGALERQKEFFDSIRSERDDLREEIVKLKEELKKHGIILNSEIANNGETSDTLNNVGYQGSTKITKEELNALKSAGDGTLGRATEVKVKNEIVENMGKRAILQNTEQEQHKEDTVKDYVSHPGENVEEQKTSGDSAPSPGPRANANCEEQVHDQVLENTAFLESPGQVESRGVIDVPDGETGASLEQPGYGRDLDKEAPVPTSGQDSCTALDIKSQSEPSVGRQEKEKQEDWKSDLEEVSSQTCQESAPVPIPEVERMNRTDVGGPSGGHLGSIVEAGGVPAGEQVGTVPASPLKHGDDPVTQGGQCVFSTSAGQSLEKELTNREAAELREAPVHSTEAGGKNSAEKGGAAEVRDEEPGHAEPQPVPGAPAAKGSHQEATGSGRADPEGELLAAKEPEEEKSDQQAEASESPQKKNKNKKKKNKKKRSPAAAESLEGVKKELSYQDAEVGEIKEEEQVQFSDKKRAVEPQNEVTQNPEQEIVAGSGEHVGCPGNGETELNGKLQQGDGDVKTRAGGVPRGGTLNPEGGTAESAGASASDKALDEDGDAKAASSAQSSPLEPEKEEGDRSSLLENSPSEDIEDASRAESAQRQDPPQHPGQVADKAQDSLGQESRELSAATGGTGDSSSEGGREAGEGSERGKSKEDCTMS